MSTGLCPHAPSSWVGVIGVDLVDDKPHAAASTCFRDACLGRCYAWVRTRVDSDQRITFRMYKTLRRRLFEGVLP